MFNACMTIGLVVGFVFAFFLVLGKEWYDGR